MDLSIKPVYGAASQGVLHDDGVLSYGKWAVVYRASYVEHRQGVAEIILNLDWLPCRTTIGPLRKLLSIFRVVINIFLGLSLDKSCSKRQQA